MEQTEREVETCVAHDCQCVDFAISRPRDYCYERHPSESLVCTRKKGHSGHHLACAPTIHNIGSWPPTATIQATLGEPRPAGRKKDKVYIDDNIQSLKTIKAKIDNIEMDIDDQEDNSVQSRIDDFMTNIRIELEKILDLVERGTNSKSF